MTFTGVDRSCALLISLGFLATFLYNRAHPKWWGNQPGANTVCQQFNNTLLTIRKWIISVGDHETFVGFVVLTAVTFPVQQVPTAILACLLQRSGKLRTAWRIIREVFRYVTERLPTRIYRFVVHGTSSCMVRLASGFCPLPLRLCTLVTSLWQCGVRSRCSGGGHSPSRRGWGGLPSGQTGV